MSKADIMKIRVCTNSHANMHSTNRVIIEVDRKEWESMNEEERLAWVTERAWEMEMLEVWHEEVGE